MPYAPDLNKISILIKTFLRDDHLFAAIAGITTSMPEARVIVVDDGRPTPAKDGLYDTLLKQGHVIIRMPFDSGFGAKSNAAMRAAHERPYLLVGSDDFDFMPQDVCSGVKKLVSVLDDSYANVDIVSGRVNNYPYEGWLEDHDDRIVEKYVKIDDGMLDRTSNNGTAFHPCNLTVNYSLIRTSILGIPESCEPGIHWDEDVKIGGGEHGAFFVDVMRAGHRVAYVPGVNICEQQGKPVSLEYQNFRGRARRPERPCFQRRGIREYVMFGGAIERSAI